MLKSAHYFYVNFTGKATISQLPVMATMILQLIEKIVDAIVLLALLGALIIFGSCTFQIESIY